MSTLFDSEEEHSDILMSIGCQYINPTIKNWLVILLTINVDNSVCGDVGINTQYRIHPLGPLLHLIDYDTATGEQLTS
jgi:hypothetical protein